MRGTPFPFSPCGRREATLRRLVRTVVIVLGANHPLPRNVMPGTSRKYPFLRRSRAMWGSRRVWQPRLVFWAGAIAIGLISVLFAVLADRAQDLFHMITGNDGGWRGCLPFAITPLGFIVCAWLAHAFFPGSQ